MDQPLGGGYSGHGAALNLRLHQASQEDGERLNVMLILQWKSSLFLFEDLAYSAYGILAYSVTHYLRRDWGRHCDAGEADFEQTRGGAKSHWGHQIPSCIATLLSSYAATCRPQPSVGPVLWHSSLDP